MFTNEVLILLYYMVGVLLFMVFVFYYPPPKHVKMLDFLILATVFTSLWLPVVVVGLLFLIFHLFYNISREIEKRYCDKRKVDL